MNGDGHYFVRNSLTFGGTGASGRYIQWANDKTCSETPVVAQEWADSSWRLGETTAAGTAVDRTHTFMNVVIARPYVLDGTRVRAAVLLSLV